MSNKAAPPPKDGPGDDKTPPALAQLQRDGLLLFRFLVRGPGRRLPSVESDGDQARAAGNGALPCDVDCSLLFVPVSKLCDDKGAVAKLLRCVDTLRDRAMPANVRSIRFTAAYLGIDIEGAALRCCNKRWPIRLLLWLSLHLRWRWKTFGVWRPLLFTFVIGWLMLLMSIFLLAHIDFGRRLLRQLADLRQQESEIQSAIAQLPPKETRLRSIVIPGGGGPLGFIGTVLNQQLAGLTGIRTSGGILPCAVPQYTDATGKAIVVNNFKTLSLESVTAGQSHRVVWREPLTPAAIALCQRYDDNRVRLAVIYVGLADWNCRTDGFVSMVKSNRLLEAIESALSPDANAREPAQWGVVRWVTNWFHPNTPFSCGKSKLPLPPEIDYATWQSHEAWVKATTAVLAGFALPLMLGCLGGCTYVLRRTRSRISNWTLEPSDGRQALTRVLLAALMGGLLGVVFSSDDGVKLGSYTLSLAALAFFVGFAVEGVFKLLDTLIANVLAAFTNSARPDRQRR